MINIINDPRTEQWFEISDIKETTKYSYTVYLKQFCKCVGKSPTELIDESIQETRKGLLLSERQTMNYIPKFKKCLKDNNKSPKTQTMAMSVIRSFYASFDIQLPSSVSRTKKTLPLKENQYQLSKDDVKKLLANAKNLRDRAIIFCMTTGGMGRQEILNLKIKNIKFDDSGIGIINIRREKAQVDFITFISPEAVQALKIYFEERNRTPEMAIKNDNDYVFVTYESKGGGKKGSKIGDRVFLQNFKKLGDQLGFGNGKFHVKSSSHTFRKFFSNTLRDGGMSKDRIDFMLGHTQSGNDLAYFKNNLEPVKQLYLQYLPHLTFEKTIEVITLDAEKLEIINKENQQLKEKIEQIEKDQEEAEKKRFEEWQNQQAEISQMNQEFDTMKKIRQDMQDMMKEMEILKKLKKNV